MKKLFFSFFLLPAFLLTVAQAREAGNTTTNPNQSPTPPGNFLLPPGFGNSELIICDEAAKTFSEPFDKSRFKNMSAFSSNGTFNVPAGVTEVLIEMWGAGGGGHTPGGGGGSGGYWIGLIPVTGINTITLTVGAGGAGGTGSTAGGTGGNTGFSCTGFNVSTGGGGGGDSTITSLIESYIGGRNGVAMVNLSTMPAGFNSFYAMPGQQGSPTTVSYIQVNATTFTRVFTIGSGGIAPFSGQQPNPVVSHVSPPGSGIRGVISSVLSNSPLVAFASGGSPSSLGVTNGGGSGRVAIYF
jgi:hypothetical protein